MIVKKALLAIRKALGTVAEYVTIEVDGIYPSISSVLCACRADFWDTDIKADPAPVSSCGVFNLVG